MMCNPPVSDLVFEDSHLCPDLHIPFSSRPGEGAQSLPGIAFVCSHEQQCLSGKKLTASTEAFYFRCASP